MTRLMLTRVPLAAEAEEEEEPLNRPEEDEGEMMTPEPRPTCKKAG
jgi:hypothetical protein